MPGSANFEMFMEKNKQKLLAVFLTNEECPLNSSVVWVLITEGERLFHCGIVRWEKKLFRASLYVWYLQY